MIGDSLVGESGDLWQENFSLFYSSALGRLISFPSSYLTLHLTIFSRLSSWLSSSISSYQPPLPGGQVIALESRVSAAEAGVGGQQAEWEWQRERVALLTRDTASHVTAMHYLRDTNFALKQVLASGLRELVSAWSLRKDFCKVGCWSK